MLCNLALCEGKEKRRGGSPMSPRRARLIMGMNMFDVEEAAVSFGIRSSAEEMMALAEVPFSEEILEACKDNHVLVAVLPVSLLDIRGSCEGAGLFYNQDWYENKAFAKECGKVGWQLIRKTPVADSLSKTSDEQIKLLSKDEEVPSARVLVCAMIGHFKVCGERLFERTWVRCSDRVSEGYPVTVGSFDSYGLDISYYCEDSRAFNLGISAVRKPALW